MRTIYNSVMIAGLFIVLFVAFLIKRLFTLIPASISQAYRRARKFVYHNQWSDRQRTDGPRFIDARGDEYPHHKHRRRGRRGGKKHRKHFHSEQ